MCAKGTMHQIALDDIAFTLAAPEAAAAQAPAPEHTAAAAAPALASAEPDVDGRNVFAGSAAQLSPPTSDPAAKRVRLAAAGAAAAQPPHTPATGTGSLARSMGSPAAAGPATPEEKNLEQEHYGRGLPAVQAPSAGVSAANAPLAAANHSSQQQAGALQGRAGRRTVAAVTSAAAAAHHEQTTARSAGGSFPRRACAQPGLNYFESDDDGADPVTGDEPPDDAAAAAATAGTSIDAENASAAHQADRDTLCSACGAHFRRSPKATSVDCPACERVMAFMQLVLPERDPNFVAAERLRLELQYPRQVMRQLAKAAAAVRAASDDWDALWRQKHRQLRSKDTGAQQRAEGTLYDRIMAAHRRATGAAAGGRASAAAAAPASPAPAQPAQQSKETDAPAADAGDSARACSLCLQGKPRTSDSYCRACRCVLARVSSRLSARAQPAVLGATFLSHLRQPARLAAYCALRLQTEDTQALLACALGDKAAAFHAATEAPVPADKGGAVHDVPPDATVHAHKRARPGAGGSLVAASPGHGKCGHGGGVLDGGDDVDDDGGYSDSLSD